MVGKIRAVDKQKGVIDLGASDPAFSPVSESHGGKLSQVVLVVKNLQEMSETWVRSQGWEDSLEESMVTLFSILAWRVPWTEEPGGLQSMGVKKSQIRLSNYTHTH